MHKTPYLSSQAKETEMDSIMLCISFNKNNINKKIGDQK